MPENQSGKKCQASGEETKRSRVQPDTRFACRPLAIDKIIKENQSIMKLLPSSFGAAVLHSDINTSQKIILSALESHKRISQKRKKSSSF